MVRPVHFPTSDEISSHVNICRGVLALFDAVLCSENNLKDIQSVLKEMYRVLKTGGVYLMISHGAPDNRVNHIKRYIEVDIDVIPIRK